MEIAFERNWMENIIAGSRNADDIANAIAGSSQFKINIEEAVKAALNESADPSRQHD
jgi:uncharacterized protein YfdQ (DUF2303 family)